MPKKFYTLDDLYEFCKKNDFSHFSSKEAGGPIIVQSYGLFSAEDVSNQGLVPVTLQSCHTELNSNKSYISEDVMNKALPSFANKPILAHIHQLDDGSYDFEQHNVELEEDENSEDGFRIEYVEQPIGIVPESCNAHLEYDKDKQKNYVVVTGYIYEDYGNRAVEIIKNNGGQTKVSVEIAVNEMSYNAKEGYLNIDDMFFMGVTCLGKYSDGTVIEEGMKGSNLKLDSFSAKENSLLGNKYSDKLVDLLSNINKKLDDISNINFNKKGVKNDMNHFEELLEKYSVSADDINFEYENMTDEELDVKFEEIFGEDEDIENENEDTDEGTDEGTDEDEEDSDDDGEEFGCKKKKKCSEEDVSEKFVRTFKVEISHDDIRCALYNLIGIYDEEDNDWYYIRDVYDNYFYMESWCTNKIYKQQYNVDGENVALDGDRQEMFELILTESEKLTVEKMRENYAALEEKYNELKSFKDNYDASTLASEKNSIFERAEYECIKDTEDFKNLVSDAEKYSVEEVETKCDLLFAAHMKSAGNFASHEEKKSHSVGNNIVDKPKKNRKTYGSLFD